MTTKEKIEISESRCDEKAQTKLLVMEPDANAQGVIEEMITYSKLREEINSNSTCENFYDLPSRVRHYPIRPSTITSSRVLESDSLCKQFLSILDEVNDSRENNDLLDGHIADILHTAQSIYKYANLDAERPIRRIMVLIEGAFKYLPSEKLTQGIVESLRNIIQTISINWPCKDSDVATFGFELKEAGLDIHKPLTRFPDMPEKIIIKQCDSIEIVEI